MMSAVDIPHLHQAADSLEAQYGVIAGEAANDGAAAVVSLGTRSDNACDFSGAIFGVLVAADRVASTRSWMMKRPVFCGTAIG
jgi:hypothetical protein